MTAMQFDFIPLPLDGAEEGSGRVYSEAPPMADRDVRDTGHSWREQVTNYRIFYELMGGTPVRRMEPIEVSATAYGEGPTTIVCLHSISSASAEFDELIGDLSGSVRVLTVDLRGFGRSHRPTGPIDVGTLAEDVSLVLATDAERVRTIVYGHGLGASVAVALTELTKVDALILSDAALAPGEPNVLADIPSLARVEPEEVIQRVSQITHEDPSLKDLTPQIIGETISAWLAHDCRSILADLTIPVLILERSDTYEKPLASTSQIDGIRAKVALYEHEFQSDTPPGSSGYPRASDEIKLWLTSLQESDWMRYDES